MTLAVEGSRFLSSPVSQLEASAESMDLCSQAPSGAVAGSKGPTGVFESTIPASAATFCHSLAQTTVGWTPRTGATRGMNNESFFFLLDCLTSLALPSRKPQISGPISRKSNSRDRTCLMSDQRFLLKI